MSYMCALLVFFLETPRWINQVDFHTYRFLPKYICISKNLFTLDNNSVFPGLVYIYVNTDRGRCRSGYSGSRSYS